MKNIFLDKIRSELKKYKIDGLPLSTVPVSTLTPTSKQTVITTTKTTNLSTSTSPTSQSINFAILNGLHNEGLSSSHIPYLPHLQLKAIGPPSIRPYGLNTAQQIVSGQTNSLANSWNTNSKFVASGPPSWPSTLYSNAHSLEGDHYSKGYILMF